VSTLRTAALLVLVASSTLAHDRTLSYSTWDVRGREASVSVRVTRLDVSRFAWAADAGPDLDQVLGEHLARFVRLQAGETPCAVADGPRPLAAPPGELVEAWRVRCPGNEPLRLETDLLFDVAPTHLHFARVRLDGIDLEERVLSTYERVWFLDPAAGAGRGLGGYVVLGIEHILRGWDHLAFLFALLLLGGSLGDVARVVVGFTAGHSITLALTVLGIVHPERAPLEALIAFSLAFVAAENSWLVGTRGRLVPACIVGALVVLAAAAAAGHGSLPALTLAGLALFAACYFALLGRLSRPAALRAGAAFVFGLAHGIGFAGVLLDAHIEASRVVHALFGFNLGVEIGQLAVVALVCPGLLLLGRRTTARLAVVEVGSAAVAALGLFWFVTRAYG
jgi:HupE / UreJ protein